MRNAILPVSAILLAACAASTSQTASTPALDLPASVAIVDGTNGQPLDVSALLQRIASADIVLLGELHDNSTHHEVRGQLIRALADRRPAVVFEQFTESSAPIPLPPGGEPTDEWLDLHGFDRQSWRWPLHKPVVDAAITHARSIWGSNVSREALRPIVREGESAAPAHLRGILERAPMTADAQAALDRELVAGHCGQLPANMVTGMRAAQTVRDAAMTRALLSAHASGGPAWLIAGNGHVRKDFAVPRILRVASPSLNVLAVGFIERTPTGLMPDLSAQGDFDIVVLTPRANRPDPCAGFQVR